jgi:nicotinate-nucleotide adenylyltransferase
MSAREVDLWRGARIGVLGGTFDPPHSGHVQMARQARDALGLDRVLFSVAPRPPHKHSSATTPYPHRVEMVRLAIEGAAGLHLTRIEEPHDVSFTVELLRACRARTSADLYFIIGADSLAEIPGWKEPAEILRLATLVVFARGDAPLRLGVEGPAALVVFESRLDVSSTSLRAQLAAGTAPAASVAPAVADYATRHALYRAS